jgi:hypothetical protein
LTIGYERAPSKTVLGRVLITLYIYIYIYSKLEHVIQRELFF